MNDEIDSPRVNRIYGENRLGSHSGTLAKKEENISLEILSLRN